MKKIVHFGAGKLGRGLIGQIYHNAGYHVVFVDFNQEIVELFNKKKEYTIHAIEGEKKIKVNNISALHLSETDKIIKNMLEADVISTAVVPSNLINLVDIFNEFIKIKKETNNLIKTNIVCIENGIKVTDVFEKSLLDTNVKNLTFCNAIADGICMLSENVPKEDVLVENFQELCFESKNWIGEKIPKIKYYQNLEPLIAKKFWLLNSTQSLISWYGWGKYKYINEYDKDQEIINITNKHMDWVSEVLLDNYSELTIEHLNQYREFIVERFLNKNVSDTIERVARNFKLKMSDGDRFVTIIKKAKNIEPGLATLKDLYKLNEKHIFDKEIAEFSKKNGIKKAIQKFSKIQLT